MSGLRRRFLELPLYGRLTVAVMSVVSGSTAAALLLAISWSWANPDLHFAELWPIVLAGMPLALVLMGALVFLVTRSTLAPIVQLTSEANAINHAALSQRVTRPEGKGEVAALADTLNAMLDNIDRGVRQQKRFVSDASHELRSPVTAILSNAELALAPEATDADLREAAQVARRNAGRLSDLIDNLVALAVVEEGSAEAQLGQVDLNAVVLGEIEARQAGMAIDVLLPTATLVIGNAQHMRWAIGTVLDNALRHSREKTVVRISADDLGYVVSIDDDGDGVPAELREQVFERFARVETSRARSTGGAGLGLAIAKAVTEAHGGWAWIADSPLGGARVELGFAFDGEHMD